MNEALSCPWEPAQYLIFSENVPTLLFYSHFTAAGVAILLGVMLLLVAKNRTSALTLSALLLLFAAWSTVDVIIWASNDPASVLFWWSLIVLTEPLLYIIATYCLYTFIYNKLPNFTYNVAFFILLLPLILLTPSYLNLTGINLFDCVADENYLALYYTYFVEILCILFIVITAIRAVRLQGTESAKKIALFTGGLIAFLLAFTSGNIIGSLTGDWDLAQYGLFGMPIFAGVLAYMIVNFRMYNLSIIGSQALVVTLWVLIASLLFVARSPVTISVAGFTLISALILGFILIRSVRREVRQREEIEKLAKQLARANKRLRELDKTKSEFVSIASHQLRSPLTSMRGYASMLLEGSYGQLPAKAKDIVSRIADSTKIMAASIEDYLNVSRIEAGNMKYELSDFNLKDRTERITDDKRQEAIHKGLLLLFKSNLNSTGIVHADVGKTEQILHNLINNAMKYTVKGSITVYVHDDLKAKKIYVDIKDTGIGMSADTIANLFGKFTRAENANSVNISGTGLGLYVARSLAQAMKGDITATSEGDGKGSCFRLTLPLQM